MSSSFTDPNDSQNESEANFVIGHMMEVEDDALLTAEPELGSELDEEEFIVQPYQDEPIANPEWVANYYEERREHEDRLEMLRNRLEGRVTVESW